MRMLGTFASDFPHARRAGLHIPHMAPGEQPEVIDQMYDKQIYRGWRIALYSDITL